MMHEQIISVFQRVFDESVITDDMSQDNYQNWDSMHHFQLIVELEQEFGISFDPDDISEMKSITAIENKIQKLTAIN
jgi:acyl carrier protein